VSETVEAQLFEVTEAAIDKVLDIRSSEDAPEALGLRIETTAVSGAANNPMQGGLVIRNPNKPDLLAGADLELSGTIPEQLQQLLDQHINPSLASHGGFANLLGVDGPTAYITMGGGCQGCAMSAATLREGITVMITEAIPEITDVVDATDHEAGDNPYFART